MPTEVIKQRMQAGHYQSITQAISSIRTLEGWTGFYRGYAATVLREVKSSFSLLFLFRSIHAES